MLEKFNEGVINNYKKLYETKENYDTKIYVCEKSNIKEFHVHSFVLKTQSEFFKKVFITEDGIEKKDDYFIIKLRNSPKVFEILLSYMYGNIDLTEITKLYSREILNLLLSSDEFELQSLVPLVQETLIKNHKDFIIKNILEIVESIYQKKFIKKLWDFCIQEICCKPRLLLFKSIEFLRLNPAILEIILERDDFTVDNEIVIWENLLKWARKQQPVIQRDIDKWNKDDFTLMERRLNRFIPLIRFHYISSEEFFLKVYPFKKLLPNDLINNIFAYHMVPNNKLNINMQLPRLYSAIINPHHVNIFASWIDKKEAFHYNEVEHNPYKFKLIYRASKDGNTAAAFHEKCDNKGATIVIVKAKNSGHIIGGYNPFQWDSSNSYKSTNDSFIFSFTNRSNLQSAKASYGCSIYCSSYNGPSFSDLYCQDNNVWSIYNRYSKIDKPQNKSTFNVDDYEVFQVVT